MPRSPSPLTPFVAALATVAVLSGCGTGPEGTSTNQPEQGAAESATPAPTAPTPSPTAPPGPAPTAGASPQPEPTGPRSRIRNVPERQWQRMVDAGMVRPECPVQERTMLRRVDLPFVDFDGVERQGHLIVRRDVARSVRRIFTTLYEAEFPIERMVGVERYDGDTNDSLRANNTSAYNCRRSDQINAPFLASPHANGRAVDVNPVQNPWQDLRCRCWMPGPEHHERTEGPGKILEGDLVWRAFDREGWIWQNIDVPDYMHFDTGYPSAPFSPPARDAG